MKHSVYLQNRIAELRAVLNMTTGPDWAFFQKDFVDMLDKTAFDAWKDMPASNSLAIIECQQSGKLADAIRAWPKKLEQRIESYALELEAINREDAEDPDEDVAT